jgi:transcriptional antiterminator
MAKTVATKQERATLIALARTLFTAQVKRWIEGKFVKGKRPYGDFRKLLMAQFKEKLEVSNSSAATMFNNLRKEALTNDPELVLHRDPKIARIKSERGPGRPKSTKVEDTKVETAEKESV